VIHVRDNCLPVLFLIILFSTGLVAGSSRALAFTAGLQGDPVVTRSYVREAVDRHLVPVQQEIDRAQKRLASLQQRFNNLTH